MRPRIKEWKFRLSFFVLALVISVFAEDLRPQFDKSSYLGTLWSQVNPWWAPNKPRTGCPLGGPNVARKIYPDDPVAYWRTAMEECKAKGMTGWQFELVTASPAYGNNLKDAIKAAEELGDFKLAIFLSMFRPQGGVEEAIQQLETQFKMFEEEYRNSDAFFRIDGAPVLVVYGSWCFSPEEWPKIQQAFEARFGHAIWLANIWWGTYEAKTKPDEIRKYMPVFDGITAYANWDDETELYRVVGKVMHEEFPDKIFEASVHNTYAVHFIHTGVHIECSRKYRRSWENMLANKPDSVVMTNLFDHWENSLVLPCYEREDLLLRYAEEKMSELYGREFKAKSEPEAVVTNYIDMVAGMRDLLFEVVTFPIDGDDKDYAYELELLDETGAVIHTFPRTEQPLDVLRTQEFTLPSAQFAGRMVIPRLKGFWKGAARPELTCPATWVDPALRGSMMFWATSTANLLQLKSGDLNISLNAHNAGSIIDWNETNGKAVLGGTMEADGVTIVRVMRNGEQFHTNKQRHFNAFFELDLPLPRLNDDYYWVELETASGNRVHSLPIWVTANPDAPLVTTVIPDGKGNYVDTQLPPGRIPVFYYPCTQDTGTTLMDIGSLRHDANHQQNSVGYAFGSCPRTGYRHFVGNGFIKTVPGLFQRDEDGRGYLKLGDTKSFFMMTGGTCFPYSCTYEISVRPTSLGQYMGILGTVNFGLNVNVDDKGYVHLWRNLSKTDEDKENGQTVSICSLEPLKLNEWTRIAVTYDCRKLTLYINGIPQGSAEGAPIRIAQTANYIALGCSVKFLHNALDFFQGDIREIRFTGRALSPEEFLK